MNSYSPQQFANALFKEPDSSSTDNQSVAIAFNDSRIGMRVGASGSSTLVFNFREWEAFISGVKDGQFDLATMKQWND